LKDRYGRNPTHVVGLWTQIVDNKKQALRGLKKIANDT
jgi:hypothetical protein